MFASGRRHCDRDLVADRNSGSIEEQPATYSWSFQRERSESRLVRICEDLLLVIESDFRCSSSRSNGETHHSL